jgi:hypothetical protein
LSPFALGQVDRLVRADAHRRTLRNRPRKVTTDAEALALFAELEAVPMQRRRSAEFKARSREFAERLGLLDESFCSCVGVLERESEPCRPPDLIARDAWFRCRAVRKQLLEAARLSGKRGARAN